MTDAVLDLSSVPAADGYAGDVSPEEAWTVLQSDENAVLIDVRTQAEWAFVGMPDLSGANGAMLAVEWSLFPTNQVNGAFTDQVQSGLDQIGTKGGPIFLLCRSGVRSIAAAKALTMSGHGACYNVLTGFEGNPNGHGHRGTVGGWKVAGLPWRQN